MARMQGVKEQVHMPLYDAFVVPPPRDAAGTASTFETALGPDQRVLRFFMDVQGKTKLETNLQASGVLPSQNVFEARALRVVTSKNDDSFISKLIYSSVTSLIVGEKTMIEMPSFWFPSGAGIYSGNGNSAGHGSPDPMATFRFADAVRIEPSQNFRVELAFPSGIPTAVKSATGELRVWVIIDGYLTRDVQ